MSNSSDVQKKDRWRKSIRNGLSATGFVTALVVVFVLCFVFRIDLQVVVVAVVIVLGLGVGIPLAVHAVRENNDIKDENATCQPIMKKYWNGHSTKALVEDYDEWTKGEHSSYSRVHFGGDVVGELMEAKAYEDALRILDELGGIEMKARERYDYENYRDQVRPTIVEGIEKQERQAEERARNKNLRKKK